MTYQFQLIYLSRRQGVNREIDAAAGRTILIGDGPVEVVTTATGTCVSPASTWSSTSAEMICRLFFTRWLGRAHGPFEPHIEHLDLRKMLLPLLLLGAKLLQRPEKLLVLAIHLRQTRRDTARTMQRRMNGFQYLCRTQRGVLTKRAYGAPEQAQELFALHLEFCLFNQVGAVCEGRFLPGYPVGEQEGFVVFYEIGEAATGIGHL